MTYPKSHPTTLPPNTTSHVVSSVLNMAIGADHPSPPDSSADFYKGVGLAISSSLFIGSSFIVKKKGLLKVARNSGGRAASGGYAYLREWLWWVGLLSMVVGEAANFSAYAFASAIVVTPLGALSVIVSAILSSYLLKERLNIHGKLGCVLCILGSTIVVVEAPEEQVVTTMDAFIARLQDGVFVSYSVFVLLLSFVFIWHFAPLYGNKNMLFYITICSVIGSLSVMGCKGLGIAIKLTLSGENQLTHVATWMLVAVVAMCIVTQMNYLNRALDIFNTSLVTPIYYVMFTSSTILASFILFKDWQRMNVRTVIGSLCGFFTIVIGVFLLQFFKDVELPKDMFNSVSLAGCLQQAQHILGLSSCSSCDSLESGLRSGSKNREECVRLHDVNRIEESDEEEVFSRSSMNGSTNLQSPSSS